MRGRDRPVLTIEALTLGYGGKVVVADAAFVLEDGQIGSLLGPSGCGKSTLLRGIAGFERPMTGAVTVDGRTLSTPGSWVEPEDRRIGMVFQDVALFPHLDVGRNISFGLRGAGRTAQRRRVKELLELFGLEGYEDRMPHSLSGGEQQRIAVARAMAPKPKLLLMDEAFSSLDAELRQTLVPEVRRILKRENMSALLVTHDHEEAFAMADRVGVMNAGRILQWDEPYVLYHLPNSKFVAQFVGEGQLIEAVAIDGAKLQSVLGTHTVHPGHDVAIGNSVEILVRPDDIVHDRASELTGRVVDISFRGSHYQYLTEMDNGERLWCIAESHSRFETGDRIELLPKLEHLVVFDEAGTGTSYDSTLDTLLMSLSVNPFV